MANASQTFRGTAVLEDPKTVTIYNVTTPGTADTETSQALTAGTKQFTIKVRGESNLKLAFVATESGTNYVSVPCGASYTVSNINFSGTIYFQVDKATQVVEILEWST